VRHVHRSRGGRYQAEPFATRKTYSVLDIWGLRKPDFARLNVKDGLARGHREDCLIGGELNLLCESVAEQLLLTNDRKNIKIIPSDKK
jgi:hypothetical protein